MEHHQSRIRQFLRRLTAVDWHSADDMAQDSFLLAYRKIGQYQASGSFGAWLHSIAWRQFLSWQRKRARRAEVVMLNEIVVDQSSAVAAELTAQRLMQVLSTDQRVAVTLSYSVGMTHAQISEITGFPLGTVKTHIGRGIRKMKRLLEGDDNGVAAPVHQTVFEEKRHAG